MNSTKYTLDRIEDGFAVFLKYPEEIEQLILPITAIDQSLQAGDRVFIQEIDNTFHIDLLKEETEQKKAEVQSLMDKLRRKK
ncbi:DUF3006 domain-containing protein [Lysinibacillus sp. NPDC097162]|uniref:DUF3006 domain-containing protein n=1 Tax=Lysinibacillus sp. NPDC097162 TaxID=3364140 RepID=UPI0038279BB7